MPRSAVSSVTQQSWNSLFYILVSLDDDMLTGTVKLASLEACGRVLGMSTTSNPYRGFRFPAEIINQAVWLYHCFSLSLREVELILAARGIVVSYETIREWGTVAVT
jgi:hypothetical protein